jgi:hypothetical protein
LTGFNLRDGQCIQRADFFEVRNRFGGIALRQKREAEKLVGNRKIRA